jgi:hypothetical protein
MRINAMQDHQVNCVNEKWDQQWSVLEPSSTDDHPRWERRVEANERRIKEVDISL